MKQIQWARYKKWNGKPRLECVDGQHPPLKSPVVVLPWTCRGEGKRPSRQTGKATLINGLLLGRSEVLRSLRHYLWAQSQGHHTIDHLEKRGTERGNPRRCFSWKDKRGPSSIRWTSKPFQRQRWGNFWETGWSTHGHFRVHRYHPEPNWTEMKTFIQACSQTPKLTDDWIPLADTKRAGDHPLSANRPQKAQAKCLETLACTKTTYTFVEKQSWQQQNASCRTAKTTSGWGRTAGKATLFTL